LRSLPSAHRVSGPSYHFYVMISDIDMTASPRRPYRMTVRADTAAATAERILDATVEVFFESHDAQVSLEEVASRAGVTVRTVIRRFGGKERLFIAAIDRETERVSAERNRAVVGDVAGAVGVLLESYEATGDRMLGVLATAQHLPALAMIIDRGRTLHLRWCERVFASALAGRVGVQRERRLAQLMAICDVYTWKLLRRDAGLSRRQTELAIVEMLTPLTRVS